MFDTGIDVFAVTAETARLCVHYSWNGVRRTSAGAIAAKVSDKERAMVMAGFMIAGAQRPGLQLKRFAPAISCSF